MSHMANYKTAIVNPNPKLLEYAHKMTLEEFKDHWAFESWISKTKYKLIPTAQGTQLEIITDDMFSKDVTALFQQIYQALATELALTQMGYQVTTQKNTQGEYIVQGVIA